MNFHSKREILILKIAYTNKFLCSEVSFILFNERPSWQKCFLTSYVHSQKHSCWYLNQQNHFTYYKQFLNLSKFSLFSPLLNTCHTCQRDPITKFMIPSQFLSLIPFFQSRQIIIFQVQKKENRFSFAFSFHQSKGKDKSIYLSSKILPHL